MTPEIEVETGRTALAIRNHSAEAGRVVIAVGPFVWGSGASTKKAVAHACRCLDDATRAAATFMILDAPEGTTLDSLGNIRTRRGAEDSVRELGRIRWAIIQPGD